MSSSQASSQHTNEEQRASSLRETSAASNKNDHRGRTRSASSDATPGVDGAPQSQRRRITATPLLSSTNNNNLMINIDDLMAYMRQQHQQQQQQQQEVTDDEGMAVAVSTPTVATPQQPRQQPKETDMETQARVYQHGWDSSRVCSSKKLPRSHGFSSMITTTDALCKRFKRMRQATMMTAQQIITENPSKAAYVQMEEDVWPGLNSNILIVRDFYDHAFTNPNLFGLLQEQPRLTRFIISGTPGIGKSSFGLYLMYRMLVAGKSVLYQSHHFGQTIACFAGNNGSVWVSNNVWELATHIKTELHMEIDLYLSDSIPPVGECCDLARFAIMITSPNYERCSDFKKRGAITRYLPVYDDDEMTYLRELVYHTQDADGVATRLLEWGGVPRNVFFLAQPEQQLELQDAYSRFIDHPNTMFEVLEKIKRSVDMEVMSHRLIHYDVDRDTLEFKAYRFASKCVERKIFEQVIKSDQVRMDEFMRLFREIPCKEGHRLYGSFYEYLAHIALAKGGRFRCRYLPRTPGANRPRNIVIKAENNDDLLLELPPAQQVKYVDETEFTFAVDGSGNNSSLPYWIPKSKNFPAVDFLLWNGCMGNMTMNMEHTIKIAQLLKKLTNINLVQEKKLFFFWIVPKDVFESGFVSFAHHETPKGRPLTRDEKALWQKLHQFVVEVNVKHIL